MTKSTNESTSEGGDIVFANLLVAIALRKTHGIAFAAAFVEEFKGEIQLAAIGASTRRSQHSEDG